MQANLAFSRRNEACRKWLPSYHFLKEELVLEIVRPEFIARSMRNERTRLNQSPTSLKGGETGFVRRLLTVTRHMRLPASTIVFGPCHNRRIKRRCGQEQDQYLLSHVVCQTVFTPFDSPTESSRAVLSSTRCPRLSNGSSPTQSTRKRRLTTREVGGAFLHECRDALFVVLCLATPQMGYCFFVQHGAKVRV